MLILRTPEAASNAGGPALEHSNPAPVVPPGTPPPGDGLPEAARVVMLAADPGRVAELQAALQAEKDSHARTAAEKRARETRLSELEDELRAAKEALKPTPVPAKRVEKPKRSILGEWLTGTGAFAAEDE